MFVVGTELHIGVALMTITHPYVELHF
jgi:hypothetical protein